MLSRLCEAGWWAKGAAYVPIAIVYKPGAHPRRAARPTLSHLPLSPGACLRHLRVCAHRLSLARCPRTHLIMPAAARTGPPSRPTSLRLIVGSGESAYEPLAPV